MQPTLEDLLGRLLTDVNFRNQMIASPDDALSQYNLDQIELQTIKQLNLDLWYKPSLTNIELGSPDITGGRRTR